MERITRKEIMQSMSVHNLTKDILRLSENKDIVDRVHDIELALQVVKQEMNISLYGNFEGRKG